MYTVEKISRRTYQASGPIVKSPQDAESLMRQHGAYDDSREVATALYVNSQCVVVGIDLVGVGDVTSCPLSPAQILRRALGANATGVILAHCHPSGDPTPSKEDIAVTRRVAVALRIVGIRFLDHLVLGRLAARSILHETPSLQEDVISRVALACVAETPKRYGHVYTMHRVVTYQHAYVVGESDVCEQCMQDEWVREALPTLGPVQHGLHDGVCDGCALREAEPGEPK